MDKVCKDENYSDWDELGENINKVIEKYSIGGECEEKGSQSHGSTLKALELFREFYVVFDS